MVDWIKRPVECGECGAALMRFLYRPKDRKRIKMFFCGTTCKGDWQRKQHPVSDDWLRERYLTDGMSANDIAPLVDRDPKSVWTWIKGAGIDTRPRGHVEALLFKPGQQSPMKGKTHSEKTRRQIGAAKIGKRLSYKSGHSAWKGVTGAAHPSWRGGHTPERASFYSSIEWREACKSVWHRADAKCERCSLDSRSVPAKMRRFHIHHIVSFQVREKRAEVDNLVLLCAPCHRFVHSKENTDNLMIARGK